MPTTKQRVDRLELKMVELAEAQMQTQVALKTLSGAQARTEASLKTLSEGMQKFREETQAALKTLSEAQARTEGSLKTLSEGMQKFREETQIALKTLSEAQARTEASLKTFSEGMQKSREEMNQKWGEVINRLGTLVEDMVAPNIPRIAKEAFGWSDIEDFMVRRKVRNKRDRSKRQEFDVIAVGEEQLIINETKSRPEVEDVDAFIDLLAEAKDYFPEHADKTIIPIFASLYLDESLVKYLTRRKIYAMMMGEMTMSIVNFQQVGDRRSSDSDT